MRSGKKTCLGCLTCTMAFLLTGPTIKAYDFESPDHGYGASDRLYLGFSIAEGAYFNYRCESNMGCDEVVVAPLNFELLLGYKIAPHFYVDLGVNWGVNFEYYDKVTYLAGIRPGVRLVLPGLFHRHLYFRGAVPVEYTLDEEKMLIVGLLLGVGLEWRFANTGFFLEADILPYFVEVYPGYYVIPAQGRAGVSIRF